MFTTYPNTVDWVPSLKVLVLADSSAPEVNMASKLPRFLTNQAFVGRSWTSLIHGGSIMDLTGLWHINTWIQVLWYFPVVSGTRALVADPLSSVFFEVRSDLFRDVSWMYNCIRSGAILKPDQGLGPFELWGHSRAVFAVWQGASFCCTGAWPSGRTTGLWQCLSGWWVEWVYKNENQNVLDMSASILCCWHEDFKTKAGVWGSSPWREESFRGFLLSCIPVFFKEWKWQKRYTAKEVLAYIILILLLIIWKRCRTIWTLWQELAWMNQLH